MNLKFEEIFKVPLKALTISRAHPDVPKDLKWFLPFLIVHGVYVMYFLILVYNITYYNLKAGDFAQTCKNGIFCVMVLSVSFQYAILVWKKKLISSLLESVKRDYIKAKRLSANEQKIILTYAKKSIWVGKIWYTLSICGCIIFPIKNIVMHIYFYIIGDFRWIHLYDLIFPKFINDRKDHMIMFCVLYALMLFYYSYCGCIYCCFSPLGANFMLHACGQMEILIKRLENLCLENRFAHDICKDLKSIAMELQIIYNFVDEIKEAFRVAFELFLKSTSIVIPVTMYAVVEAFTAGDLCVEFIVFIIGAILLSFSPCYYGELLMEKGEMFRMALYCCGWEQTWDRRTRTMILLLLQRASRPLAIRTVFRTLCLDTLTDVCRQSYTIFSLINAIWN